MREYCNVRSMIYGSKENLTTFIVENTLIHNNPALRSFRGNIKVYKLFNQTDKYALDLTLRGITWDKQDKLVDAWLELLENAESYNLNYELIRYMVSKLFEKKYSPHARAFINVEYQVIENFVKSELLDVLGF